MPVRVATSATDKFSGALINDSACVLFSSECLGIDYLVVTPRS
jgi:hypothetical protein